MVFCSWATVIAATGVVNAAAQPDTSPQATAIKLRDEAMAGHSVAYSWVSELTTRFGP